YTLVQVTMELSSEITTSTPPAQGSPAPYVLYVSPSFDLSSLNSSSLSRSPTPSKSEEPSTSPPAQLVVLSFCPQRSSNSLGDECNSSYLGNPSSSPGLSVDCVMTIPSQYK